MRKKGYTLAELLVVMGMTSVVMSIGLGMIHRVMREKTSVAQANAVQRVAQHLSTILRGDVHHSNGAELLSAGDDGEQKLVLSQPEETVVTYVVLRNEIRRTVIQKNERPHHHDSFRFPENCRLQFRDASDRRVTFAVFEHPHTRLVNTNDTTDRPGIESNLRRTVMHVEASVGRDHRFLIESRKSNEP